MYRRMAREFPEFDQSALPAIPAPWADISWHNDTCPSFEPVEGVSVFIDFATPEDREVPDRPRYTVYSPGEDDVVGYHTDDWTEVLAHVANLMQQTACVQNQPVK